MFQSLSKKITAVFDKIKGRGLLTEDDLNSALREIRIALLEADVALPVAKDFCQKVKESAIGKEIIKSISPGQMIIKIVHDELVKLLDSPEEEQNLIIDGQKPVVYLMAGLQGSGKTTTSGKIALHLREKKKKKVLVASLDIYRPAAQKQLEIVANQAGIKSLSIIENQSVEDITKRALNTAKTEGYDTLILDTAGRLHIDDDLMNEIQNVQNLAKPTETLLVVDSMTGQDAVNIAKSFSEKINITGTVLTRVDGDTRGGAALSMRFITQKPIKLMGFGEKIETLDIFDAQRIASRILDMGDIVSLVEKTKTFVEEEDAKKLSKKLESGKFDLNDLMKQIQQMKKMGGLDGIMGMLPGIGKFQNKIKQAGLNEKMLNHQVAIIQSMTKIEKKNPKLLNASRKRRIASGSGTTAQEINKLLKQYEQMRDAMKKMKKMGLKGAMMSQFSKMMGR